MKIYPSWWPRTRGLYLMGTVHLAFADRLSPSLASADDGGNAQTIELSTTKASLTPGHWIDKPGANPVSVIGTAVMGLRHRLGWRFSLNRNLFHVSSTKISMNSWNRVLLVAETKNSKQIQLFVPSVPLRYFLDKGKGAVATLLVQQGTLNVQDPIVVGNTAMTRPGCRSSWTIYSSFYHWFERSANGGWPLCGLWRWKSLRVQPVKNVPNVRWWNNAANRTALSLWKSLWYLEGRKWNLLMSSLKPTRNKVRLKLPPPFKRLSGTVKVTIVHSAVGAINESDVTPQSFKMPSSSDLTSALLQARVNKLKMRKSTNHLQSRLKKWKMPWRVCWILSSRKSSGKQLFVKP